MNRPEKRLKTQITMSVVTLLTLMAIIGTTFKTNVYAQSSHETEVVQQQAQDEEMPSVLNSALIAAAIAFGLGAISAGFAISHVGAAAMGAVAEKPEIAGQALIFVALAEGIVVFGFITALMILGKV